MSRLPSNHAVCPKLLLVMVACAIGGAFFLIPRNKELWTRLATDSDEARLMEIADAQLGTTRMTPAGSDSKDAGSIADFLARQESAKATAALEMVFEKFNFSKLSEEEREALKELVTGTSHPVECWSALYKPGRYDVLATGFAQSLADAVAQRAVSKNNPALASQIYGELSANIADCPTEILLNSIQAHRFVRKSKAALAAIDEVHRRRPLLSGERQVQIDLCREVGDYSRAYTLLETQFDAERDLPTRDRILRELVACADETKSEAEIARFIRILLQSCPQDKASLSELHGMQSSEDDAQTLQVYANRCGDLALYTEWADNPDWDLALHYHARAAVLGHADSLDRMASLSSELARNDEYLKVLKIISPLKDRPDLTLELAQRLCQEGEYRLAAPAYQDYLKIKHSDAHGWFEMGCLQLELSNPEEAEQSFSKAALLDPLELEHQTRWAESLVQLRRYEDAMQVYMAVPDAIHDIGSLESFLLLAESLGKTELTVQVAQSLIKKKSTTKSLDWLDLADLQMENGDESGALHTLAKGRQLHPQSSLLLQAQVQILQMQKRLLEARGLLLAATCPMEMKTACMMVEVFADLEDPACLAKLPADVVSAYPWPYDSLTQLGYLCELGARPQQAQALYRMSAESGNAAAADMLVSLSEDEPDPQAWLRLGDLLRSLGREKEAESAYQKSLEIIRERAISAASETTESLESSDQPTVGSAERSPAEPPAR